MPLTKLRRPKYDRQDIKQRLFTPFLSCQRLHKIQQLLKFKRIDGILIIIGIDGRFNAGSLELFNYLFFDVFTTRKDDIDRSKLDDDVFDDVMVLVTASQVHVCCNGANYWLLLPYIAHWPGLRLHCISEAEMEDPEKLEKFKMEAFVEMTSSCNQIAVATKSRYEAIDGEPFDSMVVENWPIVQSYAYDDFGQYSQENTKKGFFTLVHKVTDLSADVHKVLQEIDPVHLENIYQRVLPQIEGLIENICQLLDSKSSDETFEIVEEIIEEPVVSYYKHLKNKIGPYPNSLNMYPFVLTGPNTRKLILWDKMTKDCDFTAPNREKVVKNPTHMVIQCLSLHSGIVIGRTVFLQGSGSLMKYEAEIDKNSADVSKLSAAYNAILSTVDFVINHIKSSKDLILNEKEAKEYLKNLLNKTRYENCIFKIQKLGDSNDGHGFIIVIQGVVFDIINEDRGENLGSVTFADTFVVTKTPLTKEEDIYATLRLGKRIPLFGYWTNIKCLSNLHQIMNDIYQLEPICTEMVDVIVTNRHFQETIVHQLYCTFYADHILFYHKRIGASLVYASSIDIFAGESYGDWTIVSFTCSVDRSKNINWLLGPNNENVVFHMVFPNPSKLRKYLINLIIPQWKESLPINYLDHVKCPFLDVSWQFIQNWMKTNQLPITDDMSSQSIIDGISENVHQSELLNIYYSMNFSLVHRKSCIRVFSQLMVLSYSLRFYDNLQSLENLFQLHNELFLSYEQNWRPHSILEHRKLTEIRKPLPSLPSDSSIVVTVLCGLPGSGQDFLSRKITKIIRDDVHWIFVNPFSLNEVQPLTENMLKSFDKSIENESKNFRILLFAPPLCFPSEIVKALANVVSKIPVLIGSICICLNPESSYFDNYDCTLPGVLDMCNEGWVNTIILTGTDGESAKTANLHRMLRARNDLCTIFLTPKADVTKELDSILSVAFQQKRLDEARFLYPLPLCQTVCGAETLKKISNGFYEITFSVYGRLLKENMVKTIRDIFKSLKPSPYQRNIYFIDGVIKIEEDPKNLFSLTAVSLTKQLTFSPMKNTNRGDHSKNGGARSKFLRIYFTTEKNIDFNNFDEVSNLKTYFLSILKKFQRQIPEKLKKISKSDLSQQQIDEIHKKRHLETLPEGWFYNGITYVHMDGSRSDKHPALSEFIDSFLAEENLEIEKNNRTFDTITVKDAFLKE